jgi:hypothetical protein
VVLKAEDFGPYKSREEIWAERIRTDKNLITWPFTKDIVNQAVRYFGAHHRPLLTYKYQDDEYDQIVVAESIGSGYRLYDSDTSVNMPEAGTWRELAEWLGEDPEEFIDGQGLARDFLDRDLNSGVLEEYTPYDATPEGRAFDLFTDLFYPPASYRFPIGELGLDCGNGPHAWIEPKVALTFLQIHLDHEGTGIKVVLEEDWLREKRAAGKDE